MAKQVPTDQGVTIECGSVDSMRNMLRDLARQVEELETEIEALLSQADTATEGESAQAVGQYQTRMKARRMHAVGSGTPFRELHDFVTLALHDICGINFTVGDLYGGFAVIADRTGNHNGEAAKASIPQALFTPEQIAALAALEIRPNAAGRYDLADLNRADLDFLDGLLIPPAPETPSTPPSRPQGGSSSQDDPPAPNNPPPPEPTPNAEDNPPPPAEDPAPDAPTVPPEAAAETDPQEDGEGAALVGGGAVVGGVGMTQSQNGAAEAEADDAASDGDEPAYISAANRELYDQLVETRQALDTIKQTPDPTPEVEAEVTELEGQIKALEQRLERVTPNKGADIERIRAMEGSTTSQAVLDATRPADQSVGCVHHICERMPIPSEIAANAHMWDDRALSYPQYGIKVGDVPLAGSVLVMEALHPYAHDVYGHVMYVEKVENGVIWVTDNMHPEPIPLTDLTTEASGPNIKFLYLPWHTRG